MSKLVLFEKQDVLGFMTDFYRDDKGNLYMTGEQIGRCLGYAEPRKAVLKIYERYKDRLAKYSVLTKLVSTEGVVKLTTPSKRSNGGAQKTLLFSERGIYLIAMKSNQPKAWDFQEAVAGILENLRKGYQVWLLEREAGKYARRSLTDTIRDEYPDSPNKKLMYKNFTDLVYKVVTGKNAKQLKEIYGEPLRDNLPPDILKRVKSAECIAKSMVELGCPYSYIKTALSISIPINEKLGQ